MALIIEDPELDQKIHTVANALGKSVEETLRMALDRIEVPPPSNEAMQKMGDEIDWPSVRRILAKVDARPVTDSRSPDEIVGYNDQGFFD